MGITVLPHETLEPVNVGYHTEEEFAIAGGYKTSRAQELTGRVAATVIAFVPMGFSLDDGSE
jgi:hypothetical protein